MSTLFQHEKQTKHKYFYIFTPKQVKSIEITPNKQETPQDWVRLSGFIWIGLVMFNSIRYLLSTKTKTDRFALSTKTRTTPNTGI